MVAHHLDSMASDNVRLIKIKFKKIRILLHFYISSFHTYTKAWVEIIWRGCKSVIFTSCCRRFTHKWIMMIAVYYLWLLYIILFLLREIKYLHVQCSCVTWNFFERYFRYWRFRSAMTIVTLSWIFTSMWNHNNKSFF